MSDKIRVLVVDDSALMRKVLREMIEADKDFEVAGIARDGIDAVEKARELRPDVVTMDINMPNLDGLTSLQIIINEKICPVVMVSSLTTENSITTFEALELGAFDYVAKPGGTVSAKMDTVAVELKEKLKAAVKSKRRFFKRGGFISKPSPIQKIVKKPIVQSDYTNDFKAVVIGISTGGPKTITEVIPHFTTDLNAVFFLIQHMPPNFTKSFADRLNTMCPIDIKECAAADEVKPGRMFVGKGGFHLNIMRKIGGSIIIRTPTLPEHQFLPSVDICMESVLEVFGDKTIGVLMTGMGEDGARAMVKIREAGGYTIAESEETAIVFGMPQRAIEMGGADIVLPSYEIGKAIAAAVRK